MVKKRLGIFAAAAMAISLGVASPAHADPATDFLAHVSEYGFNVGAQGADMEIMLANAATICGYLHFGFTPEQARRYIHYQYPDATPQQLAGFVEAAQTTFCGPLFAPVTTGW
jgi:hypothetical protein